MIVRVCSHCQRRLEGTQQRPVAVGNPIQRDELEELAERDGVTHGFCVPCFELLFGALDEEDDHVAAA